MLCFVLCQMILKVEIYYYCKNMSFNFKKYISIKATVVSNLSYHIHERPDRISPKSNALISDKLYLERPERTEPSP
jgi:hypothetical protein